MANYNMKVGDGNKPLSSLDYISGSNNSSSGGAVLIRTESMTSLSVTSETTSDTVYVINSPISAFSINCIDVIPSEVDVNFTASADFTMSVTGDGCLNRVGDFNFLANESYTVAVRGGSVVSSKKVVEPSHVSTTTVNIKGDIGSESAVSITTVAITEDSVADVTVPKRDVVHVDCAGTYKNTNDEDVLALGIFIPTGETIDNEYLLKDASGNIVAIGTYYADGSFDLDDKTLENPNEGGWTGFALDDETTIEVYSGAPEAGKVYEVIKSPNALYVCDSTGEFYTVVDATKNEVTYKQFAKLVDSNLVTLDSLTDKLNNITISANKITGNLPYSQISNVPNITYTRTLGYISTTESLVLSTALDANAATTVKTYTVTTNSSSLSINVDVNTPRELIVLINYASSLTKPLQLTLSGTYKIVGSIPDFTPISTSTNIISIVAGQVVFGVSNTNN